MPHLTIHISINLLIGHGGYECCLFDTGLLDWGTYDSKRTDFGIRPLVSIPMDKVKIIGNKVKIDK